MTTQIDTLQNNRTDAFTKLLWVTPLTMFIASIANLLLYFVVGSMIPSIGAWSGAGTTQIVVANIVYLLIGAVVLAIIARISSQPARHFHIVAYIGLAISMFLPLSAWMGNGAEGTSGPDTATAITLGLMHIVSFAICVPMFTRLVLDKKA